MMLKALAKSMASDELQVHITSSYNHLRYGLGVIAVLFPALLYIGGRVFGIKPQDSMSAYYFATSAQGVEPAMRVWFIGLLFAIGVFLILYKGFSQLENWLLNVAGACAIGVAVFPMPWNCGNACPQLSIHFVFAIGLFVCVGLVSWVCAPDTLSLINDLGVRAKYRRIYRINAIAMVLSPFFAWLFTQISGLTTQVVFYVEAIGIWAFAFYWCTKGMEMRKTHADRLGAQGLLRTQPFAARALGREVTVHNGLAI